MAAFDLLVALATGCLPNLKLIAEMLTEMFYSDKDDAILDWEYLPPVGPRPHNGFVGKFAFTNHRWRFYLIQIFWHLYFAYFLKWWDYFFFQKFL